MQVKQQGPNATVCSFADGSEILFSYQTPVAGFIPGLGYFYTVKKWSKTTSKHISKYLGPDKARANTITQEALDERASRASLVPAGA